MMRSLDLDPAMAQSANVAAPIVGHASEPAPTTAPAVADVAAALDAAAVQGAALVTAIDQRSMGGYAAHRDATAAHVAIDADNAQTLAAVAQALAAVKP